MGIFDPLRVFRTRSSVVFLPPLPAPWGGREAVGLSSVCGDPGPQERSPQSGAFAPGVEEGALLGPYRLVAAFPEQKLWGRGPFPTFYVSNFASTPGLPATAGGGGLLPPAP